MHDQLLLAAADATGPDWLTISSTVIAVLLGVLTLLGALRKWVGDSVRTSDGRTVAQVVEQNTTLLGDLVNTVDRLADDVREVRTHQSGLTDRVTSLERRMDNLPRDSHRWRR